MKAIDLFCGAGGLSLGMRSQGVTTVLANEIDKNFANTYKVNHPECKVICEDIHKIDFKKEVSFLNLKDKVDIVSGGPPCQGFSTVGKKDQKDARNALFWEFIRVVEEVRPKFVIFENVSGFKKMYQGEAFEKLVKELEALHYKVVSALLDAVDYGLPQKRQRTIVIGWLEKKKNFFFPEPSFIINKKPLSLMDAISDLPPIKNGSINDCYKTDPQNEYQIEMRKKSITLTEHNASNYGAKMQRILEIIPSGGSVKDLPLELRPKSYFANTYARLLPDKPAPTITRNFGTPSSSRCIHPFENRALSTREGARLQGFHDSYIFCGGKTNKNLQIGNAVPPILGSIIMQGILRMQ